MNAKWKNLVALVTVALLFAGVNTAQACATCFGKSDSKLAQGMNWGIFSLLIIILSVLGGISAFFIFIARRAARINGMAGQSESTGS